MLCTDVHAVTDTAASSVVINADTLEIIYQNDPFTKRSMASTTKIMTALLLAESGRLDETIRCTAEMVTVEGSALGLRAGDLITARDLLYGIMLVSGNDAANVCACFLAGSPEKFAVMMNERAAELGLGSTNFVTPSGLDADDHYTTAYDLAVLTAHALKNDEFAAACSAKTASVSFGDPLGKYTVSNHNRLLRSYEGCIGVKTGYTKKSGRCLVSAARRDGKTVIAVTLNDPNDWRDHASMLDHGFERLECKTFTSSEYSPRLELIGSKSQAVDLKFDGITVASLPENQDKFSLQLCLPDYIFAPVERGRTVGRAIVTFDGKTVAEAPVYTLTAEQASEPRQKSFPDRVSEYFRFIIKSF